MIPGLSVFASLCVFARNGIVQKVSRKDAKRRKDAKPHLLAVRFDRIPLLPVHFSSLPVLSILRSIWTATGGLSLGALVAVNRFF